MTDNRFEITIRGYDKQQVEDELKRLEASLLRLSSLNQELSTQLKSTQQQLQESERELSMRQQPDFTSLGFRAATILSTAEETSKKLISDAETEAQEIVDLAKQEASALMFEAETNYQSLTSETQRRAQRLLSSAESEAAQLREKTQQEADRLIHDANREAARVRGLVATELAGLRTQASRDIALRKAQLEKEFSNRMHLYALDNQEMISRAREIVETSVLDQIESEVSSRREQAESLYSKRQAEALAETENYIASAQRDLSELLGKLNNLRLEIETLELAAVTTNRATVASAREKAEAIIHQAEVESKELISEASQRIRSIEKAANQRIQHLEQQAASIETYLENLKQVISNLTAAKKPDGE